MSFSDPFFDPAMDHSLAPPPPLPHPLPIESDQHRTPTATTFADPSAYANLSGQNLAPQQAATRDSFGGTGDKRPYTGDSAPPLTSDNAPVEPTGDSAAVDRSNSQRSKQSRNSGGAADDEDGEDSPDKDSGDDTSRPTKKKKSQKFFCTNYPPCNLSFTRSEHLARHIRKHTGERPFECHCHRRFSRLDNLRQHAQTVHVNEEIPADSLAATSTRFQRQIRTDRVRGHRHRNSNISTGGIQSRGHSRNVSNSSIGSMSDFGTPDDARRRHPPLAMAGALHQRPDLSLDTYGVSAFDTNHQHVPFAQSPSVPNTPSSIFSADIGSPNNGAYLRSPINLNSRSSLGWGGTNHSRRMSVPSGQAQNPFQSPHGYMASPFLSGYQGPPPAPVFAPNTGLYSSPMGAATYAGSYYRNEDDERRRTWHPSSYSSNPNESRPATSGLSYHQTPDAPQPVSSSQPAAQQAVRLPGIDSFDRLQNPSAASRRPHSQSGPMESDHHAIGLDSEDSSKRESWGSMNQNLTQLELQGTPPRDGGHFRQHSRGTPSSVTNFHRPQPSQYPPAIDPSFDAVDHQQQQQQPTTPRRLKRHGLYAGTLSAQAEAHQQANPNALRTSPEGSASSEGVQTPYINTAAEYHPGIVNGAGMVESQPTQVVIDEAQKHVQLSQQAAFLSQTSDHTHAYQHQQSSPNPVGLANSPAPESPPQRRQRQDNTDKLDTLVAVATSDQQHANTSQQ